MAIDLSVYSLDDLLSLNLLKISDSKNSLKLSGSYSGFSSEFYPFAYEICQVMYEFYLNTSEMCLAQSLT